MTLATFLKFICINLLLKIVTTEDRSLILQYDLVILNQRKQKVLFTFNNSLNIAIFQYFQLTMLFNGNSMKNSETLTISNTMNQNISFCRQLDIDIKGVLCEFQIKIQSIDGDINFRPNSQIFSETACTKMIIEVELSKIKKHGCGQIKLHEFIHRLVHFNNFLDGIQFD